MLLDNGAWSGPLVAGRALASVKIELLRLTSAAFGLRINTIWCPSSWASRVQAGGSGGRPCAVPGCALPLGVHISVQSSGQVVRRVPSSQDNCDSSPVSAGAQVCSCTGSSG
jgi:hypothetical protein